MTTEIFRLKCPQRLSIVLLTTPEQTVGRNTFCVHWCSWNTPWRNLDVHRHHWISTSSFRPLSALGDIEVFVCACSDHNTSSSNRSTAWRFISTLLPRIWTLAESNKSLFSASTDPSNAMRRLLARDLGRY